MYGEYINILIGLIKKLEGNEDVIRRAGRMIASSYARGGMLHVFGTGHSHMLALESFYRAGGLVKVNPILVDELMLHISASHSTDLEEESGIAEEIFKKYPVNRGDVIIIASNSGVNSVPVEMAEFARESGVSVIAITSIAHSIATSSRAPSGKKLYEIADIVIDNYGVKGDAAVYDKERDIYLAPTSTVIGAAIINLLVISVVEEMKKEQGPEIFISCNIDGGKEKNSALIEKYKGIIKAL